MSGTRAFLARLGADARGNTLAIVVAAIIPLLAMIGSGIELSRVYMAKTRMQSACDAASLAGRRALVNDTLTTSATDPVRVEALKFFNFNFPQGIYDTAAFTPVVTKPTSGTIQISADTTIPSAVMYIFGINTFPVWADCQAAQNFVNTDIVLVLDTTGSMLQNVSGTWTSVVADQKITALKDAVLALYDELAPIQTELQANGMRLRYGIVPYSSGVNPGAALYAASPSYIADSWTYQSRRAVYEIDDPRTTTGWTQDRCNDEDNWSWVKTSGSGGSALGTCTYTVKAQSYAGTSSQFKRWEYVPLTLDTATFKTSAAVATPGRAPGSSATSTWAGCIEERETVTTITPSSGYAIPAGAKDLDIDLVPNSDATRWKPYWPEAVYRPDSAAFPDDRGGDEWNINSTGARPQVACPSPARRLQAWTRADLVTYLNGLVATGGTYHDNGMIWGARFISAAGVFGPDNPTTFNGMPVAKHIIFMTDGLIDTGNTIYSTYGMEYWDRRVTGGWTSDPDQTGRHNQRFKMTCNAAKGLNASIWVVAFAVSTDATLAECASDASQVSTSSNRAQLIAKFTEIGKNIGALRLTQ